METDYYGIIDEVRVVLVDPEIENVTEMVDLLKSYDYKVTTVRTSLEAGYSFTMRNIEREKTRKGSEDGNKMIVNDVDTNNIDGDNEELSKETNDVPNPEEHRNNIHEVEDNIVPNGKYKWRRKNNRNDIKEDKVFKPKGRVKWTADLHATFMECLEQLGEGRCYTKSIVEVMDVSSLTWMQKCRFNNSRSSEERKSSRRPLVQESLSDSQQKSIPFFGAELRLDFVYSPNGFPRLPVSTLGWNSIEVFSLFPVC
ncbi:hypothetical protein H5410_051968 [Solanum commersonii]|uniref:Uncharacterized protein n=1 Tax=Solanum commersonii TaxID=4109 RepID=A0A9J5X1N5_SOLCO|nr:hypothetical protein H5410_051968 [Solanum commersonii]